MKKSIILLSIAFTAICIVAMNGTNPNNTIAVSNENPPGSTLHFESDIKSILNWHAESDFLFEIGSRFNATISEEKLHSAKTVLDIVPLHSNWTNQPIKKVFITLPGENNPVIGTGYGIDLNASQFQLLKSLKASESFCITANCTSVDPATGKPVNYDLVYYISITPEKEAQYTKGKTALIAYLSSNSKAQTAFVEKNKLQPGKLIFTVNKEGAITDARIEGTSGFKNIDDRLIELIKATKSEWVPAENGKGEKIAQELVLHFGIMGC